MSVDALSLAANAFSVIGLADIILRSADILYSLICRATSANKTAAAILKMLQALRQSIRACSDWAAAYEQSHFAKDDGRTVSQEVKQVLASCYKEIERLVKVVQGVNSSSTIVCKFKFAVRQEEEVQKSTEILLKYVQVLTFHLQSVAGNDLVTLRGCHATTHHNQAKTQSTLEEVKSTTKAISQEVQLVQHAATRHSDALIKVGHQINNAHDATIQSLSQIEGSVQHLSESSKTIMEQQLAMKAGFGDISSKLAEITFVESEDCNVMVEGYSLENAIAPLRFISTGLSRTVEAVARTGTQTISSSNLEWFSSEMQKVRRFAYRSAGACNLPPRGFRGPYKTSFDLRRSFATVPLRSSSVKFGDTKGFFVVEHTEAADNYGRRVQRYRFVSIYLRDSAREQTGIVGLIESSQYENYPPQVSRSLRQIAIVSSGSPAFVAVSNGSLDDLKALFSARKASPFDYDEYGQSLLKGALTTPYVPDRNERVILFLLEQGADPYMCHLAESGARNVIQSMWEPGSVSAASFLSTARLTSILQSRWSIIDEDDDLKSAVVRCFEAPRMLNQLSYIWFNFTASTWPVRDVFTELLSQGAANAEYCQQYGLDVLDCWARSINMAAQVRHCLVLLDHALTCPDITNFNLSRLIQVATGTPPGQIPEGVGTISIMEHLVNRGVDPLALDGQRMSHLHGAKSADVAKWLQRKGLEC